MRKIALILLCLYVFLTSCGNKSSIKYDGPSTINIVLLETLNLNASSDDPITYSTDNKLIVEIDQNGNILGRNVGETNITLSNNENEIRIHVIVSLFEEPTLNFGASTKEIKSIYGEPKRNFGDSIFIYGSGNDWYSWAVWEMDFFFDKNRYYEADLYLRSDLDLRISQYLEENYFYSQEITDTINGEIKTLYIYLDSPNPNNASVIVGKQYDAGPEDDILLVYAPYYDLNGSRSKVIDFPRRNRQRY